MQILNWRVKLLSTDQKMVLNELNYLFFLNPI